MMGGLMWNMVAHMTTPRSQAILRIQHHNPDFNLAPRTMS
jgi:hypothetical protein